MFSIKFVSNCLNEYDVHRNIVNISENNVNFMIEQKLKRPIIFRLTHFIDLLSVIGGWNKTKYPRKRAKRNKLKPSNHRPYRF